MALIGINRLGEYLQQKKENKPSGGMGRLSEEDIGIMFAALGLSPKQAEGNCSWQLKEEEEIREKGYGFQSLNLMYSREA